jgi:hypothetical protein
MADRLPMRSHLCENHLLGPALRGGAFFLTEVLRNYVMCTKLGGGTLNQMGVVKFPRTGCEQLITQLLGFGIEKAWRRGRCSCLSHPPPLAQLQLHGH